MRLGVHMCQLHSRLDLGRAHIATSRCALFAVNLSAFFSSSIHTFTRCMICTHVSYHSSVFSFTISFTIHNWSVAAPVESGFCVCNFLIYFNLLPLAAFYLFPHSFSLFKTCLSIMHSDNLFNDKFIHNRTFTLNCMNSRPPCARLHKMLEASRCIRR